MRTSPVVREFVISGTPGLLAETSGESCRAGLTEPLCMKPTQSSARFEVLVLPGIISMKSLFNVLNDSGPVCLRFAPRDAFFSAAALLLLMTGGMAWSQTPPAGRYALILSDNPVLTQTGAVRQSAATAQAVARNRVGSA